MRALRKNIVWIILVMSFAMGCSSIEKAESLYRQGEKQEALEMAISLLDDDNPKVRLRAVKLVGSIGGSKAGPALHERIVENDARVLREVVRNLGKVQYKPLILPPEIEFGSLGFLLTQIALKSLFLELSVEKPILFRTIS